MQQGLFITFEGGEGVSKSTQSLLLKQYLYSKGMETILTREPGGTKFGEALRGIVLNQEIDSVTELLAMMSARNQHIEEVIKPALNASRNVICDRFVDSTACYQTIDEVLTIERIYELHKNILGNFLPNLTILLDLHPEVALDRAKKRSAGHLDKNEIRNLDFHIKIYNKYLKLASLFPERIKIVDASGSKDQIHQEIIKLLDF
jgi:dTMP kinase